MSTRRRVAVLASVVVAIAALVAWSSIPRYEVREDIHAVAALWRSNEAFVFVSTVGMAQKKSAFTEHAPAPWKGLIWRAGLEQWRDLRPATTAYRIGDGRVARFDLPGMTYYLEWDLEDGRLVGRPRAGWELAGEPPPGFRWTGAGFATIPPSPRPPAGAPRILKPSDEEAAERSQEKSGPESRPGEERLRKAGWHWRLLWPAESAGGAVELPMALADGAWSLVLRHREAKGAVGEPERRITLELRGDRSSAQELFATRGQVLVSRDEFERRTRPELRPAEEQSLAPAIAGLVFGLLPVICVLLVGWLAISGPTRGLKVAVVATIVMATVAGGVAIGPETALSFLVAPAAVGILVLPLGIWIVRYPIRRVPLPLGDDEFPAFARERVRALTRAFEELGFAGPASRQHPWKVLSGTRTTCVRYLADGAGKAFVAIAVTANPRVVGRTIFSIDDETGAALLTSDRHSNQELIRDGETVFQRLRSSRSCAEMVEAHRALIARRSVRLRSIDDPVAADARISDRWVEALVRSGRVTVRGDWFGTTIASSCAAAVRALAAWMD